MFAAASSGCETDDVVARPFGFQLEARSSRWCARMCSELRACEAGELGDGCESDCSAALVALARRGDECAAVSEAIMVCYGALGCEALASPENACGVDDALWARCDGARIVDEGWIHRGTEGAVICHDGDGFSAGVGEGDSSEEPWVYCDVSGADCTDDREHRLTCTQASEHRYCTCFVDGAEDTVIEAPADGGCGDLAKVDFGCHWILP